MPVVTTIKLTGENHTDVDGVCEQIQAISDKTGVKLRGPIPLPTRRLVVPCRKAPDGEGAETWDHWEMRIHKRLLELVTNTSKDEKALKAILMINIPDSVTIELSLRNLG
jgi:small subunit ribosomal protein S10